jgi:CheY-like chemotaxis protein
MLTDRSNVLVVEDDPSLRMVLAALLSLEGYKVQTAEDGLSALASIASIPPDIIISDLNMPRMSGFVLLSLVRQNFPAILVVAMSSAFSGNQIPPGVHADAFYEKATHPVFLTRILSSMTTASTKRARHQFRMLPA